VGTPVMSMMAIDAPVSTIFLQQAFHHDLGAGAVQRADQRQRQHIFPELHDRGRQFEQFLLLPHDDLLAQISGRSRR
jgi:hypothetical protein